MAISGPERRPLPRRDCHAALAMTGSIEPGRTSDLGDTDIVNVLGRGKVALEVTNSSSPGVFRPADSDRYVHVVMPMYLQW